MNLETATVTLDALGNATRLRIFHAVAKAGDAGIPVGGLVDHLAMPAPTLSHHLSKLVKAGIVRQDRIGKTLICRIETKAVMALSAFLLRPED